MAERMNWSGEEIIAASMREQPFIAKIEDGRSIFAAMRMHEQRPA